MVGRATGEVLKYLGLRTALPLTSCLTLGKSFETESQLPPVNASYTCPTGGTSRAQKKMADVKRIYFRAKPRARGWEIWVTGAGHRAV